MTERVAVIAVHGVADQTLGDTARSIAELLIAQAPNGSGYAPGIRADLVLQVPPLEPIRQVGKTEGGIGKRLIQSAGSDFLKQGWSALGGHRSIDAGETPLTRGAGYTDYLLAKSQQNGVSAETYAAPRVSLTRTHAGAACHVDVYEMYWADLSRLSGSVPRILSEMFTLFFRLSSLGRDTVQVAAASFAGDGRWKILRRLQTALDWLYSRVLAMLFLQLLMVALVLVPLALASGRVVVVHQVASIAAGGVLALWLAYRSRNFIAAVAAGLAVGGVLFYLPAALAVGFLWLVVLSVAYDWWMRICEERFRMVRSVGWVIWGALCAIMGTVAVVNSAADGLGMWVTAALNAMEWVLLGSIAWWFVAGVLLMPAWLVTGSFAGRASPKAARASIATGQLGLIISLGFFLVLTMSGWALFNIGVKAAVDGFDYSPLIFDEQVTRCGPGTCAAGFLEDRFVHSTESFSVVCVLLLLLIAYVTLVFAPSVLSELQVVKDQSERLGKWLTGGFRYLDIVVRVIVAAGVLLAFAMGLILILYRFSGDPRVFGALDPLVEYVSAGSERFLKPLVYAAGAGTAAMSAAGGLLSRYVPWLRVPLDAGIDVDNHLREFPRKAIPRTRIFSRYVALLEHLALREKPYDRIVVVSHSQGTVISAELLRYMKERSGAAGEGDRIRALWSRLERKTRLLTAGCPLRQLYAARFPVMYDWVLGEGDPEMGPKAADVGVTEWLNVYASGDYVGRWLWSRPPVDDDVSAPMVDEHAPPAGNAYVVDAVTAGSLAGLMNGRTEKDVCLGAGAHTHYFDQDQQTVACAIDAMIASAA